MKKRILSMFLCIILLCATLSVAASAENAAIDYVFGDIEAPSADAAPSYDVTYGGSGFYPTSTGNNPNYYKNGVGWYDLTDGKNIPTTAKFKAGHQYKVMIIFEADENYIFAETVTAQINGEDAELTRLSDTLVIIELTFPALASNPFTDVSKGDYFYDPVLWAVDHGITNGMSATTFAPEANCTRAQVVTFLHRAAGCPEPSSKANPFTDVPENAYYYKAVLWAVEEGITNGMSATTFAPDASCTRAQVVTFLWRADGSGAPNSSENPFTDISFDAYYYNAVLWAVEKGITNGISADKFGPDATCTRGQIVTFLYRYVMNKEMELHILFQPEDYYMQSSMETADFVIQVKGGTAPYTFHWTVYYDDEVVEAEPVTSVSPIHVFSHSFSDYDFDEYSSISVGCDVEDANGALVNSTLARVYSGLFITSQPEDYQMASSMEEASFTVRVSGGSAPYTYEWVICYDNEEVWLQPTLTYDRSDTLNRSFSDYDFEDYRNIGVYCIITDSAGNSIESDFAAVLPKN